MQTSGAFPLHNGYAKQRPDVEAHEGQSDGVDAESCWVAYSCSCCLLFYVIAGCSAVFLGHAWLSRIKYACEHCPPKPIWNSVSILDVCLEGWQIGGSMHSSFLSVALVKRSKTYNSEDSPLVTHLSTHSPVYCINMVERPASLAFLYSVSCGRICHIKLIAWICFW